MTTYFNDLFNGTGDLDAHTPDTGFDSGPWIANSDPGDLQLSGGIVTYAGFPALDERGSVYYGDANTPSFGIPSSYQVNFVFRTGANVDPYVDGHSGIQVSLITGGDYSIGDAIEVYARLEAVPAGGWQILLYDGTTDFTQAVTVTPDTDYPGTLVITPGSQVLTLAGETLTASATAVGIYGLNEIGVRVGYGHAIKEVSVTDIYTTTTMTINSTLPMLTGILRGGGTAAGSLQPVAALMRGGGTLGATLPSMEGRLVGGSRALHTLDVDLPTIQGAMRAGNNLNGALPGMQASLTGTTTILMTVDVDLPSIQVSMAGTTGGTGVLRATLPAMEASMRAGGALNGDLPGFEGRMTGITGGVGRINATLPMLTAEMNATLGVFGIIEATLPMLVPGPYGRIVSMLPMMQATLAGRTVVAVTYEAYAVNLKPGPKMPNQVTRYTNYPFNQIVRFKNRYIGVADDGLYELGGATDYDATTPAGPAWAWYTAETSFNSPQKKNVREAMFAGRLGPSATASVSVREAVAQTYDATIVRGSSAQNHRIKYGRGLSARYWSFGWSDPDGGTCEPDAIEFEAAELGRKL